MIKKLFITFLAVLYLGVSSGATLHLQYCMGRLVKIALWHGHEKKSYACGMERVAKSSKSCCKDKHLRLKSEKSGSLTVSQIQLDGNITSLFILPYWLTNYYYAPVSMQRPVSQAPPPGFVVPVFLRNRTFRI